MLRWLANRIRSTPVDPQVWVSQLVFSDGSTLHLNSGEVILIVGSNNSGKSATLRAIRAKVSEPKRQSPVVTSVKLSTSGSENDLTRWLQLTAQLMPERTPDIAKYQAHGKEVLLAEAQRCWSRPTDGLNNLGRFFCHMLTADERLRAANPADAIALLDEPLTAPIHHLQRDDRLEARLSEQFRKAFGVDLIVNRNAGKSVPLHVGKPPQPGPGEDRVSFGYLKRLAELSTVEKQGDGMRSFAGVLLNTTVGSESILLIDEPEAFLHPPQARLLGQMLVADKPSHRQLFVATHSGDVLRGVLDGNPGNVRVVRIRREGKVNAVKELEPSEVKELWTDPLLRASNILDGVFHERVIVGESDGDARFFAAVSDALYEGPLAGQRKPDVMFTHCGGKDRLPLVVRSLRALDVPVRAVADFDILNNEHPLDKLVAAAGGNWASLKSRWKSVKVAVDAIRPQLATVDVRREVEAILSGITDAVFTKEAKKRIEDVLRQTSPWALAKKSGKAFIPSGTAIQEYERLEGKRPVPVRLAV